MKKGMVLLADAFIATTILIFFITFYFQSLPAEIVQISSTTFQSANDINRVLFEVETIHDAIITESTVQLLAQLNAITSQQLCASLKAFNTTQTHQFTVTTDDCPYENQPKSVSYMSIVTNSEIYYAVTEVWVR